MIAYSTIIDFWFKELTPKQWFAKDDDFDRLCNDRFGEVLKAAALGECFHWRETSLGRLAEIIVLDQFSRNIYRDTAKAFAQDAMALVLAQEAVAHRYDQDLSDSEKGFLYMPYMHSESKRVHEEAVRLFSQPGQEGKLEYEFRHKEIIDRFGRYPHRNEILGRKSSAEEIEFLRQPGSGF